jgi:hypothetical protein
MVEWDYISGGVPWSMSTWTTATERDQPTMIQMTLEQQQAFQQGNPVRLRDPELGAEMVICPIGLFDQMEAQLREILEDEKEQTAWVKMSMRTLAQRIREDEDD